MGLVRGEVVGRLLETIDILNESLKCEKNAEQAEYRTDCIIEVATNIKKLFAEGEKNEDNSTTKILRMSGPSEIIGVKEVEITQEDYERLDKLGLLYKPMSQGACK